MKRLLIAILCLVGWSAHAQKRFYIEKIEGGYEQPLLSKLTDSNIRVTFNRDSADYILIPTATKSGIDFAKCYVVLTSKSGDFIAKTKEIRGQSMLWNNYANAKLVGIKKIADKQLLDLIAMVK